MAGEGSSVGFSTDNERMGEIISQLKLYAGRYGKSMENLMKKIVEDVEAEMEQARSVEEDMKQLVDNIVQLSKWTRKEGAEEGFGMREVTSLMDGIKGLIRGLNVKSKNYQEGTMLKMANNKQDIERVGLTLDSLHKRLSETARHLTAIISQIPISK